MLAKLLPTLRLLGRQSLWPISGPIAEQKFGQPLVVECKFSLRQLLQRSITDIGQQWAICIIEETFIQCQIDISGEYLVYLFITPSSQEMESPVKPGRFKITSAR